MSGARHWEQDKESTVYVGNIDERCSDALVWELMAQAGPVINVHLPKDRVSQTHQGFGFVEYGNEDDAEYAVKIMNQIRVWHKPLRVNKASTDKRGENGAGLGGGNGVGAELFIGNLDPMADEKTLYDTFSRFGPLVAVPKVARDDANLSKGYGFVSYASFEASDEAIEHMHGQYMMNKEITVQYAYKKDGKGERHGDAAERALASQGRKNGVEVAIPALPAALVMPNNTPSAPAAMIGYTVPLGLPNAVTGVPPRLTPQPPPAYAGYGYGAPPALTGFGQFPAPTATVSYGYQHAPPQAPPPSRQYNPSPLQAPPSNAGLPARPPPSYGGYGGPYNFPGMQQPFPRQGGPPASFPAFSGMQPPSSLPSLPANMPPGYQPPPPPAGFGSAAPPAGVGSAAPPAGFGSGAPQ